MNSASDNTVLAYQHHASPSTYSNNPRNRLIEFYGDEGEDYRHFEKRLESYFALSDITADKRKIVILQTQLQHGARVFFDNLIEELDLSTCYSYLAAALRNEYITPQLIRRYQLAFNSMGQGIEEHPRVYLGRLKEAAKLAEIKDDVQIEMRFQTGLLPAIIIQCKLMGAETFTEYLRSADGYWNAYHQKSISIVDNPFAVRTPSRNLTLMQANQVNGATNVPVSPVVIESPAMLNLTNSMKGLHLNNLESNPVTASSDVMKIEDDKIKTLIEEGIKRHFAAATVKSSNSYGNYNDRRNNGRYNSNDNYRNDNYRANDNYRNDNSRNNDNYRNNNNDNYRGNYNDNYRNNHQDNYRNNNEGYRNNGYQNQRQQPEVPPSNDARRNPRPPVPSNDYRNNQQQGSSKN